MEQSILKIEDVKEGDKLKADGGFTCMKEGQIVVVKFDKDGDELYVECKVGWHGMEGQRCAAGEHGVDYDHYIGFYKA